MHFYFSGNLLFNFSLMQVLERNSTFVQKGVIPANTDILNSPIEYLKGAGPQRADLLKKELNIFTFNDLLNHFPHRHVIFVTRPIYILRLETCLQFLILIL